MLWIYPVFGENFRLSYLCIVEAFITQVDLHQVNPQNESAKVKNNRSKFYYLDKISIDLKSHKLLQLLIKENPDIYQLLKGSATDAEAVVAMKQWIQPRLQSKPDLNEYLQTASGVKFAYNRLEWQDYGIIRFLDYIEHAGRVFQDPNLKDEYVISHPFRQLWLAIQKGKGGAGPGFFIDMLMLFRQIKGIQKQDLPDASILQTWMKRHPSGIEPAVIEMRRKNKERIIRLIIEKIDQGILSSKRYYFEDGQSFEEKHKLVHSWWNEKNFHLKFAIRNPEMLNEFLDFSLNRETMELMRKAYKQGIPFFVNLYYLSLLNVGSKPELAGADLAIRDYVLYSQQLIEEFGEIKAWEKEDVVEAGKPNAAGWILPAGNNIHRRYPEVAILIPDTVGRACGGLCVSCQRMYDFQSGRLNFDLDKLTPKESWPEKLQRLLKYYEEDKLLKDILITGGDALMSSNQSLERILNAVLEMAKRKRANNLHLADDEKKAEIKRIRLGTRLPVYLPQRITNELCEILHDFRIRALKAGITQFVIQTHFESAMEITPEAKQGIEKLLATGWMISNQLVFTAAVSRRGHTAKLRQTLNDLGVLTYYTFSVKGFKENYHNFATNARAVQEMTEEKHLGTLNIEAMQQIEQAMQHPEMLAEKLNSIRKQHQLPFLATDRNVLNMPGVGKSLTFRTIGLTRLGRRILEFDHDHTREHSPVINEMGKIVIIESKSIKEYMDQLEDMGEDIYEYSSVFGYSCGESEALPDIWNLSKNRVKQPAESQ